MTDSIKCVVDASVAIKKFIIEPLTPKVLYRMYEHHLEIYSCWTV